MEPKRIDEFQGEYRFLSNFYPARVQLNGVYYPTVEHAYQAAKTRDPEERKLVLTQKTPGQAKRAGRKVTIRKDWGSVKITTMEYLVWQKFKNNERLARKLLDTGNAQLIEGNTWRDTFWGVCNGQGQNKLGKILMEVRSKLEKKNETFMSFA